MGPRGQIQDTGIKPHPQGHQHPYPKEAAAPKEVQPKSYIHDNNKSMGPTLSGPQIYLQEAGA